MTADDLIQQIKIKGSFPDSNNLFTNAEYLSFLNNSIQSDVSQLIVKANEEFFLTFKTYTISANKTDYRIPSRAIASTLRNVQMIDSSGAISELNRLYEEDRPYNLKGYYLKGNVIEVSPVPTDGLSSLRLSFYRRPSLLQLSSQAAKIISINTALNQVEVSAVPSAIASSTLLDFIQASSPYDVLSYDNTFSISGTTLTFTSLPADLAVGDFLSVAGTSPVANVPEEFVPLLVQSALVSCLASKKDSSLNFEVQKLENMKKSLLELITPRVKSSDLKIRNSRSLFNYFRS